MCLEALSRMSSVQSSSTEVLPGALPCNGARSFEAELVELLQSRVTGCEQVGEKVSN